MLLDRADPALDEGVVAEDLALFATPAINLFEKALEPARVDRRQRDLHLVVDRLRPTDFEVHSLLEVAADGVAGPERSCRSMRLAHPEEKGGGGRLLHGRATAAAGDRARGPARRRRSSTGGAGPAGGTVGGALRLCRRRALPGAGRRRVPPWPDGIDRLHVKARCTNRDLPLFIPLTPGQTHFDVDGGPPVLAVQSSASRPGRARH